MYCSIMSDVFQDFISLFTPSQSFDVQDQAYRFLFGYSTGGKNVKLYGGNSLLRKLSRNFVFCDV
jgi:hypothetical protein